jgi:tripartite ATP-independent transporter DctM subunit
VITAGGCLGILIPPSVILVIYAIYTEQSIGQMFVAAVIPGLIATVGYMLVVSLMARLRPAEAPAAERMPLAEKLRATAAIWPVVAVFVLVVTGMYDGWFSATEGAAIGAAATGLLAVTLGGMRWEGLRDSLLSTAVTTGLIFVVLLGAELFSAALALSRLPSDLSAAVAGLGLSPVVILLVILLIYFILGCFMESLAMVLLTLPIFVPLMLTLDFGLTPTQVLVWFGILVLMSVEVGMISPPFGLNLFVINAMAKDVPMGETYRGVLPFVASDFLRIILLALAPVLSLWLPGLW